jgi:hypothetical protein
LLPAAQIPFNRGGALGGLAGGEDLRRLGAWLICRIRLLPQQAHPALQAWIGANSAGLDSQARPSKNHATQETPGSAACKAQGKYLTISRNQFILSEWFPAFSNVLAGAHLHSQYLVRRALTVAFPPPRLS